MSDDTSTTSTNRKRSANTTLAERELLIDLVAGNADIIECKRTDGRTAQEKDLAWAAGRRRVVDRLAGRRLPP